jgi:hypothetical protein
MRRRSQPLMPECRAMKRRLITATDARVQGHEEDDADEDEAIEPPAFRRRDTRKGYFVMSLSVPIPSEARVLIIPVGDR